MFHAKIRFALVQVLVSWPEQWPLNGDPSPNEAGSFVTLGGRWPIGFNPLPNGAGSFLTVEAQWPFTSKQGGVTWFRKVFISEESGYCGVGERKCEGQRKHYEKLLLDPAAARLSRQASFFSFFASASLGFALACENAVNSQKYVSDQGVHPLIFCTAPSQSSRSHTPKSAPSTPFTCGCKGLRLALNSMALWPNARASIIRWV